MCRFPRHNRLLLIQSEQLTNENHTHLYAYTRNEFVLNKYYHSYSQLHRQHSKDVRNLPMRHRQVENRTN